jgi:hypothetical protein
VWIHFFRHWQPDSPFISSAWSHRKYGHIWMIYWLTTVDRKRLRENFSLLEPANPWWRGDAKPVPLYRITRVERLPKGVVLSLIRRVILTRTSTLCPTYSSRKIRLTQFMLELLLRLIIERVRNYTHSLHWFTKAIPPCRHHLFYVERLTVYAFT